MPYLLLLLSLLVLGGCGHTLPMVNNMDNLPTFFDKVDPDTMQVSIYIKPNQNLIADVKKTYLKIRYTMDQQVHQVKLGFEAPQEATINSVMWWPHAKKAQYMRLLLSTTAKQQLAALLPQLRQQSPQNVEITLITDVRMAAATVTNFGFSTFIKLHSDLDYQPLPHQFYPRTPPPQQGLDLATMDALDALEWPAFSSKVVTKPDE
ncbi:MAG: hypothetical protein ISP86_03680 [Shewanellaceae bacterium]|nr:hypothetical protein [Shewanellaceae bacterium]